MDLSNESRWVSSGLGSQPIRVAEGETILFINVLNLGYKDEFSSRFEKYSIFEAISLHTEATFSFG